MTILIAIVLGVLIVSGGVTLFPMVSRNRGLVAVIGGLNASLGTLAMVLAALATPLDDAVKLWVAAAVLLAATLAGGSVVELILSKHGGTEDPEREPKHNATLPMTSWIGAVERFGFSLALLLGLPTVAAILIGVKALGAYTATDNKIPAKRVLGTLVSVSWALLIFAVAAVGYPDAFGIAG